MTNPVKGEAAFTAASGERLTLRFDFEAFIAAEALIDESLLDVFAQLRKGTPRLGVIRAMLYGGLRFHHPDKTPEEVGQLVLSDGPAASEALMKALSTAMPQPEKAAAGGKKGPRPPKRRGTGTRSSPPGARKG